MLNILGCISLCLLPKGSFKKVFKLRVTPKMLLLLYLDFLVDNWSDDNGNNDDVAMMLNYQMIWDHPVVVIKDILYIFFYIDA